MGLIIYTLILAWAVFWILQFSQMMVFADQDYPGKHDKLLWSAAFILMAPMAPFGFWAYKICYKSVLDNK
ncbi:MAG: hypothetical protein P8J91_17680 [Pirellulaceae bacterium]|nr:hypothetical protein [Pirellulaceae bacterium]MDG2105586.1 hypothetical protein [Pirellulaceae bacterium]